MSSIIDRFRLDGKVAVVTVPPAGWGKAWRSRSPSWRGHCPVDILPGRPVKPGGRPWPLTESRLPQNIHGDNVRASLGERERHALPQPAGGTRDNGDFAVESKTDR